MNFSIYYKEFKNALCFISHFNFDWLDARDVESCYSVRTRTRNNLRIEESYVMNRNVVSFVNSMVFLSKYNIIFIHPHEYQSVVALLYLMVTFITYKYLSN